MFEFDQPESMEGSGGKYLDKPGIFHFLVTAVDENPTTRDGAPMAAVHVTMSVLGGTVPDCKEKETEITFWTPKADDSSDMPKKRIMAFCLACNLLKDHQPGKRVSVDLQNAIGQQVVAKIACKQKKDEATGKWVDTNPLRLDVAYSDVWHVDDERVAKNNVPLDPAALLMIDASCRKAKPAEAMDSLVVATATGGVSVDDI